MSVDYEFSTSEIELKNAESLQSPGVVVGQFNKNSAGFLSISPTRHGQPASRKN